MRLIKHPVLCNYYVTYRCNATCHFCDIWEKPSPFIK
ncbi:MAG: radical SAM protein, partial [Bacteroidetes bacterium]